MTKSGAKNRSSGGHDIQSRVDVMVVPGSGAGNVTAELVQLKKQQKGKKPSCPKDMANEGKTVKLNKEEYDTLEELRLGTSLKKLRTACGAAAAMKVEV